MRLATTLPHRRKASSLGQDMNGERVAHSPLAGIHVFHVFAFDGIDISVR